MDSRPEKGETSHFRRLKNTQALKKQSPPARQAKELIG